MLRKRGEKSPLFLFAAQVQFPRFLALRGRDSAADSHSLAFGQVARPSLYWASVRFPANEDPFWRLASRILPDHREDYFPEALLQLDTRPAKERASSVLRQEKVREDAHDNTITL
jgi:hypothetical protein